MSLSTESFEAVASLLNKYYDETLSLYFNKRHIDLLRELLLAMSPCTTISTTCTNITTIEPIVSPSLTSEVVAVISVPLVAQLINLPVAMPDDGLVYLTGGIDLLGDSLVAARNDDDSDDSSDDTSDSNAAADDDYGIDHKRRRRKLRHWDKDAVVTETPTHIAAGIGGLGGYQVAQYDGQQRSAVRNLTDLDRTQRCRVVQTVRLILAASHFWEHFHRGIEFNVVHPAFVDQVVSAARPQDRRPKRSRRRIKC